MNYLLVFFVMYFAIFRGLCYGTGLVLDVFISFLKTVRYVGWFCFVKWWLDINFKDSLGF